MSASSGKKGQKYNNLGRLDEAANFSVLNQIMYKVQLECHFKVIQNFGPGIWVTKNEWSVAFLTIPKG
jgi:hypothetical protein